MSAFIHVCACLCLHACTCLHLHLHVCVRLRLQACVCMRASASVHLRHRKLKVWTHLLLRDYGTYYTVYTHTPLSLLIREAGSFSHQSLPLWTSVHHQVLVLLLHLRLLLLRLRLCASRLLTTLIAQRTPPIVY